MTYQKYQTKHETKSRLHIQKLKKKNFKNKNKHIYKTYIYTYKNIYTKIKNI